MKSKACREKKTGRHPAIRGILALAVAFVLTAGSFSGAVWAAGSDGYYFGTCVEQSTFNKESAELKDSYYFSDSWFDEDAAVANDSLALVSMQLTAAAAASAGGGGFLEDLGFSGVTYAGAAVTDPETCNYTCGTKTLDGGRTLVAVVIESYSEDTAVKVQGWRQNFTVNGGDSASGEHFAFARAADKVIDDIKALGDENAVFWVMGQSRGGALTNLIAKRLGDSRRTVYAYTFESPATVDEAAVAGDYGYIHNYLCRDDIVTKIPMWGMTRYGKVYELKTEETDQNIQEELTRLGSEAVSDYVPDSEETELRIVDYLAGRVPTREEYSGENADSFTYEGEEVALTYSYQEALTNLIGAIMGGGLTGLADYVMENVTEAWPAIEHLVEAVKLDGTEDALPHYYGAAKGLRAFLTGASGGQLDLSESDLYAVLKLVGPFVVDKEYELTGDPAGDALGILSPGIYVGVGAGGMTYSHHFDTLIARLKALAPAPEMEDADIEISAPEAGDALDKAPAEVKAFFGGSEYIDAKGDPWVVTEAAWDTEDAALQDDSVYYLDVTLETAGHTIPEDLQLTLNGAKPFKGPEVSYEEGMAVIRVTYEIQIGDAPEVEVAFVTYGKAETPEPMMVKKGASLFAEEPPEIPELVEADGVKYKLKGWYDRNDGNGTAWEDVKATGDVTMYAKWLLYVDHIDVAFAVPSFGERIPEATVAEDAPYRIAYQYVSGPDYESTEKASMTGQYDLTVGIELKDTVNSVFATELNEWDDEVFVGTATINGTEVEESEDEEGPHYGLDCGYYGDEGIVALYYYFPVTEEEPEEAAYTVVKGGGQTWTKGSAGGAEFIIKRSAEDEETFGLFKALEIDGKAVSEDAYTKAKGSLVLGLKASYLETLAAGEHTLTARFEDGSAEAAFTIAEAKAPADDGDKPVTPDDKSKDDAVPKDDKPADTGDHSGLTAWTLLLAASVLALSGLGIARAVRRRR